MMKRWFPRRLRNKQCILYIGGTVIFVLLIIQCLTHWEVSRNRECWGYGPSHDKNTQTVPKVTKLTVPVNTTSQSNTVAIVTTHSISLLEGQETIDYIAEYLLVKFKVLENNPRDSVQAINLTNTGIAVLRAGQWQIHFNHLYKMMHEQGGVPPSGHRIRDSGFRLFHVKGSLYRVQPDLEVFRPLYPSETRTLILTGNYQQIAKSDSFPNWYVTAPGYKPQVLQSTMGESLDHVDNYNQSSWQWRRDPQEQNDPFTARVRFYMYANISHDLGRVGSLVLPTPEEADIDVNTLLGITPKDWVIISNVEFTSEAKYLADHCPIQFSYNFPKKRYIYLTKHPSNTSLGLEEYVLTVEPATEIIQVYAEGKAGAFYGVQTILALLQKDGNELVIPKAQIRDKPRFPYRGVQLDVSRNFHSKETVMKLLDSMATYKLNKLHFHLSDDEGWRLEIPGIEELTQVGGQRCHDTSEKSCLLPQLGSGPHTTTSGSGYYTLKDYREILMYAKKRHIQVIPEFDVPGHSRAAVKSMEARYTKYVPLDLESAGEFLLTEWEDQSNFSTAQSYDDGVVNVCIESTYTFLQHLIASVKELHQDIQPLDIVHIGGDEIARGVWMRSPACKTLTHERNVTDFRFFFMRRLIELLQNQGLAVGVWEDGIIPKDVYPYNIKDLRNKQAKREIYAYAWNNIWEYGRSARALTLANAGYKVVMAQSTHMYFDHPYEPDPLERGLYWATRYIDTRKVFGFIPMHLLLNADVTGRGISLANTPEKTFGCLHKDTCVLQSPENIVGLEANLWTETIRTNDQLQSMAFPRLLAMAERAWHKAPWEDILNKKERLVKLEADWITFSNTLGYRELRRLDQLGVKYRVPPPGAIIVNKELRVNCLYPNLEIEYSSDGGKTWKTAQHSKEKMRKSDTSKWPIKIYTDNNILVRTVSANKQHYSRVIPVHINKDI